MKKIIVASAAAATLAAALGVTAAFGASSAVQVVSLKFAVRYGDRAVLNGYAPAGSNVTLATAAAGKTVQAVRTTQATPKGTFKFGVVPLRRTVYVVQSEAGSATTVVDVMPRVGFLRNGTVRVAPVAPFVGRTVELQRYVDGAWVTVMHSTVARNGSAHVARWTPGQTLRVYVPSLGHGFVDGRSRVLTAEGGIVVS